MKVLNDILGYKGLKLYQYQDITKVFATFKTTIENLKTNNKTLSIVVDINTNKIKFVDAEKIYNEMMAQKQQEKENAKQERKNQKAKQNENKPKIKK